MSYPDTRNKSIEFESGLAFGNLFAQPQSDVKDLFPAASSCFLSRGRDALYCIISDLGFLPGTGVLLPSFACDEIYRPFIDAKYVPHYYRVNRDLTPDFPHICSMAKHCKVILMINYFGFNQPPPVYEKARDLGLIVIEDGSHSWLSDSISGSNRGDYCFASLRKLAPLPDGAVLTKKTAECRKEYSYIRSSNVLMFRLCRWMGLLIKGSNNKRPRAIKSWLTKEFFSSAEILLRSFPSPAPMSSLSGRILHRLDTGEIAAARRRNYLLLAQNLKTISGLNPVFPELPPGVVPYGFPVFAEKRSLLQSALESLNIQAAPLWAQSEMVPSASIDDGYIYDKTLLLPIGQDYDENDILSMAQRIRRLL